jgi:Na+/H+-dicarboxylate symporter
LPAILICVFGIFIVIKLPANELKDLVKQVFDHATMLYVLGWIISMALLMIIFIGNRGLKTYKNEELHRLAEQNRILQEELLKR